MSLTTQSFTHRIHAQKDHILSYSTYKGISRIARQVGGGREGAWIGSRGQSPARPHCTACASACREIDWRSASTPIIE